MQNVMNWNDIKNIIKKEKKHWKEHGLKDNKITKSVQLSKDLHSKVRIFAALNDESISSIIEKSINYYIEKYKG